jgi:hypothetical protein
VLVGETWEFDGQRWSLVATDGPPPLMGASMVYQERRGVMLLFGGRDSTRQRQGNTWEWDGTRWTLVATTGPEPRDFAGMAYDRRRGEAVLFGGYGGVDSAFRNLDDTWLWNGRSWRRSEVPGPSPRSDPFMAYDASRGVTVMFGGAGNPPPTFGDTWEWNGEQWSKVHE